MRYSRFKQQMEGYVPQARKPRTPKKKDATDDAPKPKKRKREQQSQSQKDEASKDKTSLATGTQDTASEVKTESTVKAEPTAPIIKAEPVVKQEPREPSIADFPLAPPLPITPSLPCAPTWKFPAAEPATVAPQDLFLPSIVTQKAPEAQMTSITLHPVKEEPIVKIEVDM